MKTEESKQRVTGSQNGLVQDAITFTETKCCSGRTGLEKGLFVISVIFFLATVGLLVALVIIGNKWEEENTAKRYPDICLTKGCVETAAEVSKKLNPDVDPCQDMFEFSCGGWLKATIIPENVGITGTYDNIVDRLATILKGVLEADKKDSDPAAFQKARDFYASCTNLAKIDELDKKPMTGYLSELGAWPLLETNWDENSFDLENLLMALAHNGIFAVIKLEVKSDLKNASVRILNIDQPDFGMPGRKYYLEGRNATQLMAYENMGVSVAVALGADRAQATRDMTDAVDLEYTLANISVPAEDRLHEDALYNKMTIEEIVKEYKGFDWLDYFKNVMGVDSLNILITKDEPVVNKSPSYFKRLSSLLQITPKRVLANYIMWRMVAKRVTALSERFRIIDQNYKKVLYGTQVPKPRWNQCVSSIQTKLPTAVGRMYIDVAFDEKTKARMIEMVANLRESFNEMLKEVDWMDDKTRKLAREKADAMVQKIAYQEDIKSDKFVNDASANYTISKEKYFENVVEISRQKSFAKLRKLRQLVDKSEWRMKPAVVNAGYDESDNEIIFPAGFLQAPFFSKDQPHSLNYGGIGWVIGHEITHGFDDKGRQYDKDGNLKQWWSDDVIAKFKENAQCMVDQYSNYTMPETGLNVNGKLTLGENIADNGGLKQSYRAYRKWIAKVGKEEPLLPGLPYNNNQLFFINMAQTMCSKLRKQTAINQILTDIHSPEPIRVLGLMQNSKEFSKVFNCPATSCMNPVKKCSVW